MQDFRDKVAVITGGANGIGRAIADLLAGEGCNLVIADIEAEHAEQAAAELRQQGIRAIGVQVDVAKGSIPSARSPTRPTLNSAP